MSADLATTNLLLAVLAVVGVIEALMFIAVGVAALLGYRALMSLAAGIEARQVAPAVAIVTGILEDLRAVSATMRDGTERVDDIVSNALRGIDNAAGRMKLTLNSRLGAIVGIGCGLQAAVRTLRHLRTSGTGPITEQETTWQKESIV